MWETTILPRICAFVPTGTILEVAPGYGRCTQFLKDLCDHLIAVDLSPRCIAACAERFPDCGIELHVNDGKSLPMVRDKSVDFVFSWDSLVHVEAGTLNAYAVELARVLKPGGAGFFHHSNIGSYAFVLKLSKRFPERIGYLKPRSALVDRGLLIDTVHWRAESVTAACFAAIFERAGVPCREQELVACGHHRFLTDCFSTFTPRGSRWDRGNRIVRNPGFPAEQRKARLAAQGSLELTTK